jgi:hypothetical protein
LGVFGKKPKTDILDQLQKKLLCIVEGKKGVCIWSLLLCQRLKPSLSVTGLPLYRRNSGGHLFICLSAVVEDPFDIFFLFFSFIFPNEWPVDFPRSR